MFRIKRDFLHKLEAMFVVIALILFSNAFLFSMREGSGFSADIAEGDPVARLVYLGIYIIACFLLLPRWQRLCYFASNAPLMLFLLVLVLSSVLWSASFALTLRRVIAILLTTIFGFYLAIRYTFQEQLRLLLWALGIIVIGSLVFVIFLPDYGLMGGRKYAGAWRGVFTHKNGLGRVVALASILFLSVIPHWRKRRMVGRIGIILALILLIFSNSAGAWVTFIALLLLWFFYRTWKWPPDVSGIIYSGLAIFGFGASLWILNNLDRILGIIGRDATLTGRTDFWPILFRMIAQRPWLGYGYSAFWLGENSAITQKVWALAGWNLGHAHNGFIDLTLNLGVVGFLLFTLGFILSLVRAVKFAVTCDGNERFWPLIYLAYMFLTNQVEGSILKTNSIYWVIYVSVFVSLAVKYPVRLGIHTRSGCTLQFQEYRS